MKKEALLYEKSNDGIIRCFLCSHHCRIAEGKFGFCGVRQNTGGVLYTLVYGDIIAAHVDPIEKKPLYHFLPGSVSYSIATVGCNFRCGFCQNWQISQVTKKNNETSGFAATPEQVIMEARKHNCRSISYTYTEPTIYFEFAYDCARLARKAGLRNVFVTNGYMTGECIQAVHPYLDAANVDLKSFNDGFYKTVCKGSLKPVLESIELMKKLGIWVEVTTLLIPGENDSDEELGRIAAFLARTGRDIPWHISAFHPDYKFNEYEPTPVETLRRAREAGIKAGLKYIYLGNVPEGSDTFCSKCGSLLISREYFSARDINIMDGKCRKCSTPVEGMWGK